MTKKPPSVYKRRNLYWPDDMDAMINALAEKLHKQGEKGIYNSKGEVNRTAVVRYAVRRELERTESEG